MSQRIQRNIEVVFTPERVKGKHIVYSTTNGTQAIHVARECSMVMIAAYLNFTAILDELLSQGKDVTILCAGWKGKFNLEDSLFAGALAERLLSSGSFTTICDSTHAAMDLYKQASGDIMKYIDKIAQKGRLKKNKLDDVIEYCHTFDVSHVIPVLRGDYLETLNT